MDQSRRCDKANGEAFPAGGQIEAEGDTGLSSAAVAERDDVLTTVDVLASRQFQGQHLVERWDGLEVEAVEASDGGKEFKLPVL